MLHIKQFPHKLSKNTGDISLYYSFMISLHFIHPQFSLNFCIRDITFVFGWLFYLLKDKRVISFYHLLKIYVVAFPLFYSIYENTRNNQEDSHRIKGGYDLSQYSQFGLLLKNIRKGRNLTQARLEELLNIERTIISNYESGKYLPNVISLIHISKQLNVPLMAFIEAICEDIEVDMPL